jgi:hypothetical protein
MYERAAENVRNTGLWEEKEGSSYENFKKREVTINVKLTAKVFMFAFRIAAPCGPVGGYQSSERTNCLHLQ